jgi:hypothetical protein
MNNQPARERRLQSPLTLEMTHNELLLKQLLTLNSEPPASVTKECQELRIKMDEWEAVYQEMSEVKGHLTRAYSDLAVVCK